MYSTNFSHLNRFEALPSRVVVIGATGFIGRNLCARLASLKISHLALSSRDCDLTDSSSVRNLSEILLPLDVIVMLAVRNPGSHATEMDFLENSKMAVNLVSVLKRISVAHFIYVSSDAVYGSKVGLVSEYSQTSPEDIYGAMHLAREIVFSQLSHIPVLLARCTAIYGPGDSHNAYGPNRFMSSSIRSRNIDLFGSGIEKRDHLFISDLISLLVKLLLRRTCGLINLVSGASISFAAVAGLVRALFEDDIQIMHCSKNMRSWHRHFDSSRLMRAFPDFAFTDIRDGLSCLKSDIEKALVCES